jgi:hypothetical protein
VPSRDDAQTIADLERELHRLRCEVRDLAEEHDQAQAAARTWRRVAQWIYEANQENSVTAYLITHPPKIRQFRDRGTTPSGVCVVHTAESTPDWVGHDTGAEGVANFISGRTDYGSYHDLTDSDSIVQLVPYGQQAYGDGTGSNPHAYHVSAATQAAKWNQASKEWREATVRNMAKAAARYARWIKREHGVTIPARRITRAQSEARVPGFISHGERDPGRRTDPGPDFPWDLFLTTYAAEMGTPQEDDMPAYSEWPKKDRDALAADIARANWTYNIPMGAHGDPRPAQALQRQAVTTRIDPDALAAAVVAALPPGKVNQATVEAGVLSALRKLVNEEN